MNCHHPELNEIKLDELRKMRLNGTDSIDCPSCGDTFELEKNPHTGTILLVKEEP